jgi:hypothetical protein
MTSCSKKPGKRCSVKELRKMVFDARALLIIAADQIQNPLIRGPMDEFLVKAVPG